MWSSRLHMLLLTVFLVGHIAGVSHGRDFPERLTVYGGVTVFNNPVFDSVALVEFPFSLKRHEFEFYQPEIEDSVFQARVFAQIDLINVEGRPIDSASTFFAMRVVGADEVTREGLRIFNKLVLYVKPGVYSARLTVIDAVSKRRGEYFIDRVVVAPARRDRVAISGTRLAYDIRYVGHETTSVNFRLVKNGFYVIPNPLSIYGTADSIIYLYSEIYNLSYSESRATDYRISLSVLAEDSTLYQAFGSRVSVKPGVSAVVTESFDIRGWQPGLYFVQLVATDFETGFSDTSLTPFRIVSPEALTAGLDTRQDSDPYDTLSLDTKVRLVTYILSPEEKATLSKLTEKGKESYLRQYWLEHDEDPSTEVIENRLELIKRFEYTNRYFSTNVGKTNGWMTDRGRVYMTYGPYEEITDIPAPRIGNPYQVWYYHSLKEGKYFILEDYWGDHDYRLVHSNVYGEIYSKEWQLKINRGEIDISDY